MYFISFGKNLSFLLYVWIFLIFTPNQLNANDFTNNSFLITKINPQNYSGNRIWNTLRTNSKTGIELDLVLDTVENQISVMYSSLEFGVVLEKISELIQADNSRIIPVFMNYSGNIQVLDSVINASKLTSRIFFLPQGETWPTMEYLVQANRRVVFFVNGNFTGESKIIHPVTNYALQVSASTLTTNSTIPGNSTNINLELFIVYNFDKLPTSVPLNRQSRNLVPDFINFLLTEWKKYGKKPNFIFVGRNIDSFDFILDQLSSFSAIKGMVRTSGKNLEKVYWKNPDVLITGGKFSFPYRGGEEIILSPFAPGYSMVPEQIIVTGEMVFPESYSISASPVKLSESLTAGFQFDGTVTDLANPTRTFDGENFSFSQDIERGQVLRLPENAYINLGEPGLYGLPNSSFTVCCFVKFTDILEFGDNAILGNYEQGYRRGMHLILRNGHPYFGLWANDFMSDETLENNTWYHLAWRYIIETGEQGIFVNGKYIGGSDGHPPYSGTSNLHIGSAFSQGASLRGYIDNLYIYERPLGNEEINRLYLDEEIILEEETKQRSFIKNRQLKFLVLAIGLIVAIAVILFLSRLFRVKKTMVYSEVSSPDSIKNQIFMFGEFTAIDAEQKNVTGLFTPKVRELFLYVLFQTLRNGIGAEVTELNSVLWEGIDSKKVANNRSVTLNKLRKILVRFDKVEILSNNGYLQLKVSKSFFCDYLEAFRLCQIPEGMTKNQLEQFFMLVKKGRFLKGIDWPWLDDTRGFIGSHVIDNLLKLASIYKKELKLKEVEKVAQRILEYDDLNEEAIYLQLWALQKAGNMRLAKFNFNSFCAKYMKNMGEPYSMDFSEFTKCYSEQL